MKKEEARFKWCPYARSIYADGGLGTLNRFKPEPVDHPAKLEILWPVECSCITDRCMAWECEVEKYTDFKKNQPIKYSTTHGYCGLVNT